MRKAVLFKITTNFKYSDLLLCHSFEEFILHFHITILFSILVIAYTWAGIAQSVYRLATGWTVRGSNPGGGEIFRTRQDRPCDPPSLLYSGYRVFPGVKRPGRGVDTHLYIAPRLKSRAIPLLHLWAFVACYRVKFTFRFILVICTYSLNNVYSWINLRTNLLAAVCYSSCTSCLCCCACCPFYQLAVRQE
jgi:hypothetical protein